MKRLVESLISCSIPARPREGDGGSISPPVDRLPTARRGPAPGRRRRQWVGVMLVIVSVLLTPWGGPCDRRSRPADPTTSRLMVICGQASEARPSFDGADPFDVLLAMYPDILEDEEDGEGSEDPSLAGQPSPFAPPLATPLGAMDGGRHHDDSGRSARSPSLRC
jgi:hypothetical protein